MVHNSSHLSSLQETVSAIEAGGQTLQVRRRDLGFVATLRSSRLELLLTGGEGVRIVSVDLADPNNERFLRELSKGAASLDLHSIEEAVIRSACLVKAMTQPVLNRIRQGSSNQVSLGLEVNDKGEAKSLKANIAGQVEPIVELDAKVMQAISREIATNVGPQSLGLEFRANRMSYYGLPLENRDAFRKWLMEPIEAMHPSGVPRLRAVRLAPAEALQSELQTVLDEDPSEWKRLLWLLAKGRTDIFQDLDLQALKGDERKKALLQALVDEMANAPWLHARSAAGAEATEDDIDEGDTLGDDAAASAARTTGASTTGASTTGASTTGARGLPGAGVGFSDDGVSAPESMTSPEMPRMAGRSPLPSSSAASNPLGTLARRAHDPRGREGVPPRAPASTHPIGPYPSTRQAATPMPIRHAASPVRASPGAATSADVASITFADLNRVMGELAKNPVIQQRFPTIWQALNGTASSAVNSAFQVLDVRKKYLLCCSLLKEASLVHQPCQASELNQGAKRYYDVVQNAEGFISRPNPLQPTSASCSSGYFTYVRGASGLPVVVTDFANKLLGGGVLSHGMVQEEIMLLECPVLLEQMLRHGLQNKTGRDSKDWRSNWAIREPVAETQAEQVGCARSNPIFFEGVRRHLAIDSSIYGDRFTGNKSRDVKPATPQQVEAAVGASEGQEPFSVLAIAAPKLNSRNFKEQTDPATILDFIATASAGLTLAVDKVGSSQFTWRTGQLGCGAFNNHYAVAYLAQRYAAAVHGIAEVEFFAYDDAMQASCEKLWQAFLTQVRNPPPNAQEASQLISTILRNHPELNQIRR